MSEVRAALIYSSLGRYILMGLGLASTVIVARLLTPEEVGTFAIASSIVMVMAEFRILGANTYLVREAELTEDKIRSAYGLTILISWSLGLAVMVAAVPLSIFFDIDSLKYIFSILAISFIFAPYISIPHAFLSRNYDFKKITIVRIASGLAGIFATVVFINLRFSYYSLAIANVLSVVVQFALYLYFTNDIRVYRPQFRNLKPIAKLGIFTSVSHVLRKMQYTAPDMVIGKMGTAGQVGIFSRGLGLMVFASEALLSGISPVALPYLADVRKKKGNIASAYNRAAQLITGFAWPVLAVISIASLPAIRFMFGDQWDQAAPVATIVAYWAMLRAANILAPHALIAVGKESSMLIKEIIVFLFFVCSIVIGYFGWGLSGAGYAFVFSGLVDFIASVYFLKYKVGVMVMPYCFSLLPSAIIAVICWITTWLVSVVSPFSTTNPGFTILQITLVLPVVWLVSVFIVKNPIRVEIIRAYNDSFGRKSMVTKK
ncbi:oligosaccharide flippase family protein [Marinobacter piscensis]|uniref:oligosaccharide flippase family protein n=1 Tax=Marinobacter piscensis TaxID=1562308 RepID=UPI0011A800D4|nr:oligosaccharide flippase family protein [Marinobacter piscensis]